MAEALISVLIQRLASVTYQHIADDVKLVLNGKEEVEKFVSTLKVIEAVLEDAEKRQVMEADVRDWLDKLTDVSYEMDDVIDEWNTEILKQENGDESALVTVQKKKVRFSVLSHCFCFGQVNRVIVRLSIVIKIKELNDTLTCIANERQRYHFQSSKSGIREEPERQKTSSFVDVSKIFGRDTEKDILVRKLLSESSQEGKELLVIPIIGMGGMGKTTLAQLAYNDAIVKTHFDKTIWVCVSDPFDVIRVAKAIITGNGNETPNLDELEDVLQCMCKSIEGKKFLLVLDDVWTQDHRKWEQLELPLLQAGAKGSTIVVTTRKQEVVTMMGATSHMIHLQELSEQNCLSLFNHIAYFGSGKDESNVYEAIGKEIVKKCKGLPLAAKTLGSLMRYKKTRKEWQNVLNSKVWELEEVEQQVFQPLLLSYHDLDSGIKRCLLYCAIFPKDYELNKDTLIEMWMSQEYLNSKGNREKRRIGESFFENLVMHSFFQDFDKDEIGNIKGCKLHDIVHDFVQFLSRKECFTAEYKGANQRMDLPDYKVRHLTLMFVPEGPLSIPISFCNCKNIRTLTVLHSRITTIEPDSMLQLKCLRTLNLRDNLIKEIPKEIGELMHLRFIDLSCSRFLKEIPESLCNLSNLQTLLLVRCKELQKLPKAMGKLINLKNLYVGSCYKLQYLPKEIASLRNLQTLDKCAVYDGDDDQAFTLGDLGIMDQLRGSLIISKLGNVKDECEAEKAQLGNKEHLLHLELNFWNAEGGQRKSDEKILNALQPHHNLESLSIRYYDGTIKSFNWINSLFNLKTVYLASWAFCELLPPLGKLPSLEMLSILGWSNVKKVGIEFLGIETQTLSQIIFPKLKHLRFRGMPGWEEWEGIGGGRENNSEITIMPCLYSLEVTYCPGLKTFPDFLPKITPLHILEIKGCPFLVRGSRKGVGKEWPKISHIPNITVGAECISRDGVLIQ